jgi:hypothetical protein
MRPKQNRALRARGELGDVMSALALFAPHHVLNCSTRDNDAQGAGEICEQCGCLRVDPSDAYAAGFGDAWSILKRGRQHDND